MFWGSGLMCPTMRGRSSYLTCTSAYTQVVMRQMGMLTVFQGFMMAHVLYCTYRSLVLPGMRPCVHAGGGEADEHIGCRNPNHGLKLGVCCGGNESDLPVVLLVIACVQSTQA